MQKTLYKTIFYVTLFIICIYPFVEISIIHELIILANVLFVMYKVLYNRECKLTKESSFWMLIFLAIYIISAFSSLNINSGVLTAMKMANLVVFTYTIRIAMDSYNKVEQALNGMLIACFFVILYGIYQYEFGMAINSDYIDHTYFTRIDSRIYSFFSNPNHYGMYLVIMFIIGITMYAKNNNKRYRFFYILICMLCGISVFLTYSRMIFLIFIFVIICTGVLMYRLKDFVVAFIVFLFGLFILVILLPEDISYRFTSIFSVFDSSYEFRVNIYSVSIKMIGDYFLTGVGIDGFSSAYNLYDYVAKSQQAHNLFLQIMVECGIFGFASFIIFIYKFLKDMIGVLRSKISDNYYLSAVIILGIISFLLFGLTEYSWLIYRVRVTFWLLIGFGMAIIDINANVKQNY